MTRKELKQSAKAALKGKIFVLLVPLIIVGLITGAVSAFGAGTFGIGILAFILTIPLTVGLANFYIKFAHDETVGVGDMFTQYKDLSMAGEQIKAFLLRWSYIFLGTICFIIPGIIMALKYSQLQYILADNPDMDYKQAMERCRSLMQNRKGEYFVLLLSFIGWFILGALTFGILYIYIAPYFELTKTKYYLSISTEYNTTSSDETKKPVELPNPKLNNSYKKQDK